MEATWAPKWGRQGSPRRFHRIPEPPRGSPETPRGGPRPPLGFPWVPRSRPREAQGSPEATPERPKVAPRSENRGQNVPQSDSPADFTAKAAPQPIVERFAADFPSKSRPKSSCDSSAPCEKSCIDAASGEHGDIAFDSVKTSVRAMFAKTQFGRKSREIDRNPHRKRHRKATCAARVAETVSATISAPKSTKNPPKSTKIGPKSVQNRSRIDFFDQLGSTWAVSGSICALLGRSWVDRRSPWVDPGSLGPPESAPRGGAGPRSPQVPLPNSLLDSYLITNYSRRVGESGFPGRIDEPADRCCVARAASVGQLVGSRVDPAPQLPRLSPRLFG